MADQKLIAEIVKYKRIGLGYTQKEVSEMSRISLRSIQRIEKGEVMPRMHTLKLLANCLDFSLDSLKNTQAIEDKSINVYKIILSLSVILLPLFLFAAFLAQSSSFPETSFESIMSWFFILSFISLFLLKIWEQKPE